MASLDSADSCVATLTDCVALWQPKETTTATQADAAADGANVSNSARSVTPGYATVDTSESKTSGLNATVPADEDAAAVELTDVSTEMVRQGPVDHSHLC